jgi:hypothetical protein
MPARPSATSSSISALPAIAEVEGRPEPYRSGQLTPLARLAADPALVYVHRDAPWRTIEELVAEARLRPGALTFSSSGLYGPTRIPIEMLLQATGTDMLHVPTTGGSPAMTMLLGRQVDVFFTIPGLGMQYVESGALRVLAASTRKGAYAQAQMRKWTKWVDEQLHPNWAGLGWTILIRPTWLQKTEEEIGGLLAKLIDPAASCASTCWTVRAASRVLCVSA